MAFMADANKGRYVPAHNWPRSAMQYLWGDWTALLPRRIRVALWNWTWHLEGAQRVNWRTMKRFSEGV